MVISLNVNEEILELAFVPFDLPMYIFAVDEDRLGIYGIAEKDKYRLFAYSPEENTFQGISFYSTGKGYLCRPFQGYEDGIFMVYDFENIYYVSQDETEYVIASTDNCFYDRSPNEYGFNKKIVYANGYLFCQESNDSRRYMERINIKDIMEEILQSE